jgi:hypothetical protein
MDPIFKTLPLELVIKVIEYLKQIKYRSGKFIDRLESHDNRYHMLNDAPYFRNRQWSYIRDLGKFFLYLHPSNINEEPTYIITITKKSNNDNYYETLRYDNHCYYELL